MALVVVRHGAGPAFFHRQPRLGAVECLDLALLVDAEHQGFVRRIEVEADDILHLVDKLLVVRQLEPARQMRLQPVRMPNPLHTGVAQAHRSGHTPGAPVRGCRGLLAQRLLHHRGNHFRRQGRLASRTGCIAPQPIDPLGKVAHLPPPHRRLALADRTHDRHRPNTRQQHNARPPHQFLGRIPVRHPTLQLRPIRRRKPDAYLSAHPSIIRQPNQFGNLLLAPVH